MVVPSGTTHARPSLQQPARRLDAVSPWHVLVHPVDIQTGSARRVDESPKATATGSETATKAAPPRRPPKTHDHEGIDQQSSPESALGRRRHSPPGIAHAIEPPRQPSTTPLSSTARPCAKGEGATTRMPIPWPARTPTDRSSEHPEPCACVASRSSDTRSPRCSCRSGARGVTVSRPRRSPGAVRAPSSAPPEARPRGGRHPVRARGTAG